MNMTMWSFRSLSLFMTTGFVLADKLVRSIEVTSDANEARVVIPRSAGFEIAVRKSVRQFAALYNREP